MKIKIERDQKEKNPKKKKERVVSAGKHRKMVLTLWLLLSRSLTFGIYKNFTAIDQHITHKRVVVKEKIVDTSGIESLTEDFAKEYFPRKNNKEAIGKRMDSLGQYFIKNSLTLIQDVARADIPMSSGVQSVKILGVEKHSEEFTVSFLVEQHIIEGKGTQPVSSAYRVTVFEDESKSYLVTSLPTMIGRPDKTKYETKQVKNDSEIDTKTTEEITDFLKTFFKLHPLASEKELEYYVENGAIWPINIDLKSSGLESPVYLQNGKNFLVSVKIEYLNNVSKITSYFQYKLVLRENGDWGTVDIK